MTRLNSSLAARRLFNGWFLVWFWLASLAHAAETIPPAPKRHFNDYAQIVSRSTAERLNRALEEFEKATSSQIVVAIFPRLPPGAVLEDFTVRTFEAWQVGQKGKDNGAVLFVFVQDRRLRMEVGYGLEGALPDALAKRIIDEEISPHFKRRDFDAGLAAGVNAILQATRGEYKGTGRIVAGGRKSPAGHGPGLGLLVFILLLAVLSASRRRGTIYHRSGRANWGGWRGGGWSSGSWSGGGWSGGGWSGGGGFSGGGGRSGGGGASGSW